MSRKKDITFLTVIAVVFFSACGRNVLVQDKPEKAAEGTEIEADLTMEIKTRDEGLRWEWVVRPEEYEDCYPVNEDWFAVKKAGKYTIIDAEGKCVFPGKYDEISPYREGVAAAVNQGEAFFIDRHGEKISDHVFQETQDFHESLAGVKINGLWGYIGHDGDLVIAGQFDEARPFSEKLAAVRMEGKWGFVDQSGVCVTGYMYDEARDFREGRAAVMIDGKWGYIGRDGEAVVDCRYDEANDFQEGCAAVMKDGRWGYIDEQGQLKIDLKYDGAGNFSENKAAVKVEHDQGGSGEWAYIDKSGEVVIDFYPYGADDGRMVYVGEFHEGKAFVSRGMYCMINDRGEYIFDGESRFFISALEYNAEYDAIPAYVYADDRMTVKKYGLVGPDGEQRLEPVFDYVHGIYGEYLLVSEKMEDEEWRYGVIRIIPR